MRKRNLNLIAFNIVLLCILLLPIGLLCLGLHTSALDSVIDYANDNWVGIMAGVPMYDIIVTTIGPTGQIPLIPAGLPILVDYMAWVFTAFALILICKVIIFVPRLCGALLDKWGLRLDD